MYNVGRVATDKFGCRMIRRPFVGVMSNEDAVHRVAGSAKTVSQPILPVQKNSPAEQEETTAGHDTTFGDHRNWSRALESISPVISCERKVWTFHWCQSVFFFDTLWSQLFLCRTHVHLQPTVFEYRSVHVE